MDIKEYLKEGLRLKKEAEMLTKDKDRFIFTSKGLLKDEIEEIDTFKREIVNKSEGLNRVFYSNIQKVKRQVAEVSKRLKGFVETTKRQGISSDYDSAVTSIQKSANVVNIEILDFKEKSRLEFEELNQAEKILVNELDYYANKFTQWELETPKISKPSIKSITEPKDLPPLKKEILSIDKEIQEAGGQNLGWDEVDHTEFLKVWHKHKSKATPAFFQAISNALPLQSLESIKEHVANHLNLLSLNEKKRKILEQWKEEKKKSIPEPEVVETKVQPRHQVSYEAKVRLEEWKANREKAKEEELQQKLVEEARKKEEEDKRRAELEDKRQIVMEYKERKEFEKAKSKLISEYVKKRASVEISEDDRKRLKDREDKLVEQKRLRTLAIMRNAEEKNKQDTLTKLKTQAQWAHVDSKLTQETFASTKRKEATENETDSKTRPNTFGGMLVHRPTRAVPSWRAGIH